MKNNHYNCVLLCVMILASDVAGQSLQQLQQHYPDKLAVFSNISRSVEIDLKKGIPYANAYESTQMTILNDNANGIYNKEQIFHSSFKELKKVEAYTLVPERSGTKKLKVTDFKVQSSPGQNIFYDDSKETTFDFPQLMRGSISHVETEHYYKDIRFLSPFYFSNYLPTHRASYSVTYPENVEVRYIIKNDPKKIVSVKETVKGRKKKLEFTAEGIENYERYPNGTSIPYYALHVIVYVANYRNDNTTVPVFGSVPDLYKWNSGFLTNINSNSDDNLNRVTDSICGNKKTDREKAEAIYQWVQQHIKYVAFEQGLEGFIPRHAADVYAKRYGDCKDMASILTVMLKRGGLNAYFAWIGTRSIPYSYDEVPLPITDNHMICALKMDNQWIFLDATDPHCIFGMPTSGIQGKEALISINKEQFEVVHLPVIPPMKSNITDSTFLTISNNVLQGNCSVEYSGYWGSDLYNQFQYNKGDDEREYVRRRMTKGNNKFIMKDYNIRFSDPVNKKATISSGFDLKDYMKAIDDEIYINLNLEKLLERSLIDTNTRKIAIENDFLYSINQVHTLKIPTGYEVDFIPPNTTVSNDELSFSIEYKKHGSEISATQKLELKKLYIQAQDFANWNKAIAAMSAAYKEQVVLKKK